MSGQKNNQIQLPDRLTSSADLSRTVRELEELDGVLRQARLRADQKEVHAPRSSVTLEQLAHLNNVTIVEDDQRQQLAAALATLEQDAPRIHMSLATEPSAKFTRRIVVWLRTNVHPLILLEVGLQPTLAAGCMVRTNNRIFDMSLRNRFADSRGVLMEKITKIGTEVEQKAERDAIEAANQQERAT